MAVHPGETRVYTIPAMRRDTRGTAKYFQLSRGRLLEFTKKISRTLLLVSLLLLVALASVHAADKSRKRRRSGQRTMIPSKRLYRWFYDHVHSHYYDLMIKVCVLPCGGEKKLRKRLLEPISFGPSDMILDMCCGTGSATFAIAEKAGRQARIFGLDLSSGQLRRARAKNRFPNVSFLQGDATNTSFNDGHFDKAFITHAIHEMRREERLATLREARRIIKDGGTVVVLELDDPSSLFVRIIVGFWFLYWLPFNFETPTRRDMFRRGVVNEVREAGFEDVAKASFCHGVFQVVQGAKEGPIT